ncbi:MAG: hypothetical protein N3D82_01390 [Ignisphaera sp.]|nr:hypothetical protein [Ignisphaera sp.]MCX8167671.1 hypothetical protein [Ignisphaera sp.]MDW8085661.1 hypothetical protein [Ignisphaera sp.]
MENTIGIKRFALASLYLMMVFGLVTILLGYMTNSYRGFYLSLTLGLIILITTTVYVPVIHRRKDKDIKGIAVPALQALWVTTSMALGYVVTAYAPYFNIPLAIATSLFVIGFTVLVYGVYAMLKISRVSKVPLAV